MSYVQFGKYFLLEHIASGGMAEVYKAMVVTREGEKKLVAIKRILPEYSNDDEFIAMLVDEAKIMVTLNQPNIVSLIEFGKVQNSYFIAFEYVDGINIKELILATKKRGVHIPHHLVAYIFREVCAGLNYAHSRKNETGQSLNIVHRDISPTNILLSKEGQVKILDFGIAKAAGQKHMTQVGIIRGKSGYMSPEQAGAQKGLDGRSDLFSSGIIMYEMLTLSRLFRSQDVAQSLRMIREMEIPPPRSHNRNVPEALEAIVMKALERDLRKRYGSAAEMERDLTQFLQQQGQERRAGEELSEFLQLLVPRPAVEITEPQVKREPGKSPVITDQPFEDTQPGGAHAAAPDFSPQELDQMFDDIGHRQRQGEFEGSLEDLFSEESITLIANKRYREQLAFHEASLEVLPTAQHRRRPALGWVVALVMTAAAALGWWWKEERFLSLTVTSEPPGAKVSLNGQLLPGATPLAISRALRPGQAMLEVTLEGYAPVRQAVSLRPGEAQRLHLMLRAEEGKQKILAIYSTPPSAALLLNGVLQPQKTPAVLDNINGPGPFELRLELDGYEPLTKSVTFQEQQRFQKVELYLIPQPREVKAEPRPPRPARKEPLLIRPPALPAEQTGYLHLNSVPFSTVTLKRGHAVVFRGQTPLVRQALPVGDYQAELQTKDGQRQTLLLNIEAGKDKKMPTVYFEKVEEDLLIQ